MGEGKTKPVASRHRLGLEVANGFKRSTTREMPSSIFFKKKGTAQGDG